LEVEIESIKAKTLPFILIYGGVQVRNVDHLLTKGGFSHIMLGSSYGEYRKMIAPQNRVILWTGIAQGDKDCPWAIDKSPWGNNLVDFEPRWARRLSGFAKNYGETSVAPAADFIVLDIESERQGKGVDRLRTEGKVSAELKSLNPSQFAAAYERGMRELSASAVHFLKARTGPATTKYSSYGDVPIPRNWYGIPKSSWADWQTDPALGNFMGMEGPGINNPFAAELNVNTPSAYCFFPTGQNLAYMLFQVEANKARSKKDLVLFVTPRFVGKKTYGNPISSQLAEATAIFPFFSGADGLWLWETSKDRLKKTETEVLPSYRGFFRGLERLSKYKDFFIGDYQLHIPETAHALFSSKKPVWRAVIKGGKILVVAQNPYAKEGEETVLSLEYGSWKKEVTLKGKEILLQHFAY
jgi:hypothetical protein